MNETPHTPAELQAADDAANAAYEAMPSSTPLERASKHLARLLRIPNPVAREQRTPMLTALATAEANVATAEALTRIADAIETLIATAREDNTP